MIFNKFKLLECSSEIMAVKLLVVAKQWWRGVLDPVGCR